MVPAFSACFDVGSLVDAIQRGVPRVKLDYQSGTRVEPSAAKQIADAVVESTTLTELDMSWTLMDDITAAVIAEGAEECRTLAVLNLDGNDISDIGAAVIAKAVATSTSLVELHLVTNRITNAGAAALAEAAAMSASLVMLDIEYNDITYAGVCALWQAWVRSRSLEWLEATSSSVYRYRHREVKKRARALRHAARATLALFGAPREMGNDAELAARRFLALDGDHAAWHRVAGFLLGF